MPKPLPPKVRRGQQHIGEHLGVWRRLQRLTASEVADRADVSVSTLARIESGQGASLENLLRVARALGVLDRVVGAFDPYETDVGRMRADEALPTRVRRKGAP